MVGKDRKGSHLIVKPQGTRIEADSSVSLMEIMRDAGVGLDNKCGGMGKCGKCRIIVIEGRVTQPNHIEKEFLTSLELENGYRLACQTRVAGGNDDVVVYLPYCSTILEQRFQVDGMAGQREVDPPVKALTISLDEPSLHDARSDFMRLQDKIREENGIDVREATLVSLQKLPDVLRQNEWKADLLIREGELLRVRPAAEKTSIYGLAVDLGTSKVAVFLVNLSTGEVTESAGFINPQLPYGEDVISRIQYANEGPEQASHLQDLIIKGINSRIEDIASSLHIDRNDVVELSLVGNTAMHHAFLGLPLQQLGISPYVASTNLDLEVEARDLDLGIFPEGVVYLPPVIAGFVGSDHLAAIIASRMYEEKETTLLIDVGTNTELALKASGRITCCSCASGPAFEGGALRYGMRAAEGAIERVWIEENGRVRVSTVGEAEPAGICGSGIVDALAALKSADILDEKGRMRPECPGVIRANGDTAFRLARSTKVPGEWITVTQQDVREVQKAKGAIRSGIELLLRHSAITFKDIDKIMLAGAFGNYIDPLSAISIAMLPPVPMENIMHVGNAAGVGARQLLCSMRLRREARELTHQIEYIEPANYPDYAHFFASAMLLSEEEIANYMNKMSK